ncbi:class E sortase [Streptomyces rapamycinicus]|uniref:Class E sortase n=3 Tax=Streptomyces rapamycinicus TaxID=1226757 RepID=A0A3L8RKQ6_STRRN|nr:class E sortase [Streptomyces rapamycinicus]MBB4784100.1 sortase A [Streptomyces rapamycinicus]RLV80415.1 class E sortase [Streptomyces rapamycinicus NRRL 5491]UTO64439.1 class E sortase [Streptomyces rapamycinicus]UTP32394.1 class E sortase [Streptomyces rapamycinicus NRRL 5491]
MTGPRPEREGAAQGAREPAPYAPYGSHERHAAPGARGAHGDPDVFPAAAEGLRDPLPDSAPAGPTGRATGTASLSVPPPTGRRRRARPAAAGPEEAAEAAASPTGRRRARAVPSGEEAAEAAVPPTGRRRARTAPSGPEEAAEAAGPPTGRRRARTAPTGPSGAARTAQPPTRVPGPSPRSGETSPRAAEASAPAPEAAETAVLPPVPPRGDDETVALRAMEAPPADQTMLLRKVEADPDGGPEPAPGGRAARRKAAQGAGKRAGKHGSRARRGTAEADATRAAEVAGSAGDARPRTRMEARRAARARKDSPGVVASRVVGELFITLGVVMLLFVTYQLWWTNILAHQQANGAANSLQKKWDESGDERDPGTFSPGQGFAIIYIPKLDVKAPIAEGIDKHKVLDRGMVGHYGKSPLKTAMPWDKKGNFALAGHRNTHGEPFRYINRLKPGDEIVVETQSRYYTYAMSSILPQTSPSNTGVIKPVPPGSGFTEPGRYITLTTCTPEFTSTYRMIVWGKMVDERPRSKGKPDALVE